MSNPLTETAKVKPEENGESHVLPHQCQTIRPTAIANKLLAEVRSQLSSLPRPPKLVGFLANSDPAARMYAKWTAKTCEKKYLSFSFLQ